VKRENDVVILQSGRWANIVDRVMAQAAKLHLSEEFVRTVLEAIHVESIEHQNRIMNN
jgi:chorismate mutase